MTGIFYGSTTGATEAVAQDIARMLGIPDSDIHNVAETSPDAVAPYDFLILGSSTWGCGELQDDVALFGCGDSNSYPDTFCDAIGHLFEALKQTGCTFKGSYIPEGYGVINSLICNEGQFLGLAVDESDPGKTDSRIAAWCELLKKG